jgi:hypothetical protein
MNTVPPLLPEKIIRLSPEDVIIHKLTFNRPKDWRDIADMLYTQGERIDLAYIRRWLADIFRPDETKAEIDPSLFDTRVALVDDLVATVRRSASEQR